MLQIAICDDEIKYITDISLLLNEYISVYKTDIYYKTFIDPNELIACIASGMHFDVIFLDIIMPQQNGIKAAHQIRKYDNNVKIIFLTLTSEFAVESYNVSAYFYALKPILKDSFFSLLKKVINDLQKQDTCILFIKSKSGILRIRLQQLCYVEIIDKTIYYYLQQGITLNSFGRMSELEKHLLSYPFFVKPHRSYIVNLHYLDTILPTEIVMESKARIPLAKTKYNEVKNAYLSVPFLKEKF